MKRLKTSSAALAVTLSGCFHPFDAVPSADASSTGDGDSMSGPIETADDDDEGDDDTAPQESATEATDEDPTGATVDTGADAESAGEATDTGSGGASSSETSADGGAAESSTSDGGTAMCAPLSADLHTVALWHFDDAAGQVAVDASGNGRDLTLGPTAGLETADPIWSGGAFDGGLSFTNADEDYATRNGGNTFPTNELTVEFRVRSTSDDYAQLFTAGFINCFVAMENNGAGVQFGIGDGSNWEFLSGVVPVGTLNDGAWHSIAATYDGGTMRVYADGLEIGSVAAGTSLANPSDYKVGGRPANTFLDGDMDEVRVSDVARTAEEIATAYDGCG